jgi:putative membrane protein
MPWQHDRAMLAGMSPVFVIIGSVFAGIAALIHVYIFVLESVTWTKESTRKVFGVRSAEDAELMKPLAYNQGFYNLFLAMGAFIGIGCVAFAAEGSVQSAVGWTLVFSCCGSMLLAAVVLALSGKKYLRAAATQGAMPLLAVVLGILAVIP